MNDFLNRINTKKVPKKGTTINLSKKGSNYSINLKKNNNELSFNLNWNSKTNSNQDNSLFGKIRKLT